MRKIAGVQCGLLNRDSIAEAICLFGKAEISPLLCEKEVRKMQAILGLIVWTILGVVMGISWAIYEIRNR